MRFCQERPQNLLAQISYLLTFVEKIRHTLSPFHTTRKWAPFRAEHVGSYPNHYSPAFAFSAILYPLPVHTLCSVLTDRPFPAEVNGLTEFHDDDRVGRVLPFHRRSWSQRASIF
jgi:hypothetical protein